MYVLSPEQFAVSGHWNYFAASLSPSIFLYAISRVIS
jgi:hypothetical protein